MSYIFSCPHCEGLIEVAHNELNCCIFRHAFYYEKANDTIILTSQMNPHASKEECDSAVLQNKIVGCAKPFRIIPSQEGIKVEICDYV